MGVGHGNLDDEAERLHLLLNAITDYAIVLLDAKGRVLTWNPGAERIKGYRASEILGEHFSRFYPPEDVERARPRLELERALAEGRFEEEGWRIRKDGSRFWASVVITPLRDAAGGLLGFAKVTRDLTERKQAQDRLAILADRERIARELHASTVRLLFGIGLELQATADLAREDQVRQRLETCVEQLDRAITELRCFAFDLGRSTG